MKHLLEHFKKRKDARTNCEYLAGIGGVSKLAAAYNKDGKEMVEVCEAIMHRACMEAVYDHREIAIFKTGLFALVEFMSECKQEIDLEKNVKEIKKKNKNKSY